MPLEFRHVCPCEPQILSCSSWQIHPFHKTSGNLEIGTNLYNEKSVEVPVKTHVDLLFAVERRDCFYLNKVISEPAIRTLGIIPVELNSVHYRAKKLADVTVDVEMLPSFLKVRFCKRQQVLKVWDQSKVSVRIFEPQAGFPFQFSKTAIPDFFWVDNAIPIQPFSVDPKSIIWAKFFHYYSKFNFSKL